MPDRIPVKIGRKRYTVIRDDIGLIGIEYIDAVMGKRRLNVNGVTAKRVLKAEAHQMEK